MLQKRRQTWFIAVAVLTVLLLLVWAVATRVEQRTSDSEATTSDTDALEIAAVRSEISGHPIEAPRDGYLTSRACQECHPHEHAMWHQSYHRTMTQQVTPESVLGRFDAAAVHAFGETYRHLRDGDEFYVEMTDPFWQGEGDAPRIRRQLIMSTGSHHMQVYWYESGNHRTIVQAPMAYLLAERRWVPVQSTFLKPPLNSMSHVVGGWNQSCNMCHATGSRPGLQNPNAIDTQVSEFGIACEACHGSAEEHVRFHRLARGDDVSPVVQTDATIFNPETADPRISAEACGQCHGVWVARTPQAFNDWKERGFDYRPGQDLDQRRYVLTGLKAEDAKHAAEELRADPHFLRDRFWSDGMVRIAGREYNGLIRSPCYQHGDLQRGIMQCISCHQMHPNSSDDSAPSGWANDQLAPGMNGNAACLQCHGEFAERIEQHSHHAPDSAGSQCMNCHMPYTTYGLLKAIRSHQVSSPAVQTSLDTGRPNACNQCHLDKTFGWVAEHLQQRFGVVPPENLRELQHRYAAGPLWALAGDAGQRALTAWSMGWGPAQEASGSDWMVPYLVQLLLDPYDAVRLIAHRSLQRIPGYGEVPYDFLAAQDQRQADANRLLNTWESAQTTRSRTGIELLIEPDGSLRKRTWAQMYNARDNRRVNLEE